ncbi:unnamed protein product [Brassica oleracea]
MSTRLVQIPPCGLQWIHFWNCLHGERFFLWYQSFCSVFSMRSLPPLAPCDHCRLSLHAIVAASRSTETLSSFCSDPKSVRSPFSPSIPLPVPLVIVRFVLVSLIYNGEFRVLIADFDLLLIGSEFICPD